MTQDSFDVMRNRVARLGMSMGLTVWAAAALADHELDARNLAQGARLYQEHCAVCHCVNLEGAPDWRRANDDGTLPAPPHEETGHTWHHDNQLLFDYTKLGGQAALEMRGVTGFSSAMPGFSDQISDAAIWDILAYIRSTWPEEVQEIHSGRNPQH